jgi:hypothetical protein
MYQSIGLYSSFLKFPARVQEALRRVKISMKRLPEASNAKSGDSISIVGTEYLNPGGSMDLALTYSNRFIVPNPTRQLLR